jgi:hypothetical protein
MREFLTSGVVGNIELNEQQRVRGLIMERWEGLNFLEGLEGHVKENMATLFENEAKHLMREATDSSNSGSFETVVFPIIRRVFSKLLANDIVSVQAMNLPIGKLFFILPVTSEREWDLQYKGEGDEREFVGGTASHRGLMGYERVNRNSVNANGEYDGATQKRYYLPDEVIQPVDEKGTLPEVTKYMEKTLYDLFYDDYLFDQSKGKVTIKVGKAELAGFDERGQLTSGDHAVIKACSMDNMVRNILIEVKGFSSWNAGRLTGPDGNEMDTEAFLASLKVVAKKDFGGTKGATFTAEEAIPFRVVTMKYGKGVVDYSNPCDAEGKIYLELDLTKPAKKGDETLDGYIGVDPAVVKDLSNFYVAWAQYDSLELETEIGEVSFKLDSVTVSVEERKLRATWSPELAQDVAAFHNIDAEAELTAILSEQIAAEIDREILRDLRKAAPWQARWDVNGWRRMATYSTNYTQKDWNQELITKVNQISAQIHKATLRGGANFIVVSSEISAIFDNLEYFHVSDASAESDQYNMGIERVGSLSGRYQVYRDPFSPAFSMIIGHKGKSLLDTGYIYAPYVPMQLTPTMYNPFNFAPVKGIVTRYAKKLVNNKFYGHVRVDGLTTWSTKELR